MPAEQQRRPSTSLDSVAVVIPAYNSGDGLPALVAELLEFGFGAIVVVDDGSAPSHQRWLDAVGAMPRVHLCRHLRNLGKGRALKTGFGFVAGTLAEVQIVVTADSDGQHRPLDVAMVAVAALENRGQVVMGSRSLRSGVPFRSWLGNSLTRVLFAAVSGVMLQDTQTGLRAFPRDLLAALGNLEGERYEYETAALLQLCLTLGRPREVPIDTIYFAGNRATHFRPVADSVLIYRTLAVGALRRMQGRSAIQQSA